MSKQASLLKHAPWFTRVLRSNNDNIEDRQGGESAHDLLAQGLFTKWTMILSYLTNLIISTL